MDTEYVLRIILRARDEIAGVLAKARGELRAFATDSKNASAAVNKINVAVTELNKKLDSVSNKTERWQQRIKGARSDTDKLSPSTKRATDEVARMGKQFDNTSRSAKNNTQTNQQLRASYQALRDELKRVDRQFREGEKSSKDAIFHYNQIASALNKLARASAIGSRVGGDLNRLAIRAKEAAQRVTEAEKAEINKRLEAARQETAAKEALAQEAADAEEAINKKIAEAEKEETRQVNELKKRIVRDFNDVKKRSAKEAADAEKAESKRAAEAEKEERRGVDFLAKKIVRDFNKVKSDARRADEADAKRAVREQERAAAARASQAARDELRAARAREKELDLQRRAALAQNEFARIRGAMESGAENASQLEQDLKRVGAEFSSLSRQYEIGSGRSRAFANEAGRVQSTLREVKHQIGLNEQANESFGRSVMRTAGNISTLDNRLRGIALLALFGFAQQLITVLVGLGGALVAVASSAAMAGAAIAGGLAAGIAQTLPMVGLLTASMVRLKDIFDVVSASDKLQQAQFVSGAQAQKQAADRADALTGAQDRLKDAQKRLSEARRDAVQQLQDLIFAEKEAELAARGAALSQEEAQEALRLAIQRGDVEDIARAELRVISSQVDAEKSLADARKASRAAAIAKPGGGGVEAVDEVKRAKEAVEDASRSLEKATRAADTASGSINTAALNLAYLLSQLSPAERQLYNAVTRIRENFRRLYRPITDIIIGSFTRATDRVDAVLRRPTVINTARRLSTEIAKSFDSLSTTFTSDPIIRQMERITEAGRKNIPGVTRLVESFGRIFLNVADAAGPALSRFIDYINDIVDGFVDITGQRGRLTDFFLEGERHLESWLDLFGSVIKLFAAIVGAGADEGKAMVDDLADGIDGLTAKVKGNQEGVAEFFRNSRAIAEDVLRVFVALAQEIGRSFDPGGTGGFADLIINVWIPALGQVIRAIGQIVDVINAMLQNPFVATIAKWSLALLIFSQVATSTLGAFLYMGQVVGFVGRMLGALTKFIPRFGLWRNLILVIGRALGAALLGPLGLVVGAIVLLLAKLGLLDDLARAFGQFFVGIWDQVRGPIDRLIQSFKNLGGAVGESKALTAALKAVIDVIGGAFRILGTVVGNIFARIIDTVSGFVDILTGILTLDAKKAFDGFVKIASAALNPFHNLFNDAENASRDLAKRIEEDAKKIKKADEDLAKAQKNAADAQRDLTRARREARRELSDLQARAEGGRLAVREARFSLEDAEKELRILRQRRASQDEIARAELRVDQARQSLRDTTRDATRAEQDYAARRKVPTERVESVREARTTAERASAESQAERARRRRLQEAIDFRRLAQRTFRNPPRARDASLDDIFGNVFGTRRARENIIRYKIQRSPAQKRRDDERLRRESRETGDLVADSIFTGLRRGLGLGDNHPIVKWFKNAWRDVKSFLGIESPSILFEGAGGDIVSGLSLGLASLPGALVDKFTSAFNALFDKLGEWVSKGANLVSRIFGGGGERAPQVRPLRIPNILGRTNRDTPGKDAKSQADDMREAWKDMRDTTRRGAAYIEREYRDMRVNTTRTMNRLFRDHRGLWGDIERSGKRHATDMYIGVRGSIEALQNVVYQGMRYISTTTNRALRSFDATPIRLNISAPERVRRAASGGVMGWIGNAGERGKDKVMALLGRGEVVLNHWQQKALNNMLPAGHTVQSALSQIGFHAGGKEQPGLARGGEMRSGPIVSVPGFPGERAAREILDEIRYFTRRYRGLKLTDAFGPAHKSPGHTRFGDAADFAGPDRVMDRAVQDMTRRGYKVLYDGRFGSIAFPGHGPSTVAGANAHIHVEFAAKAARTIADIATVARRVIRGRPGPLRNLAQAAFDRVRGGANRFIGSQFGDLGEEGQEYQDIESAGSVGRTLVRVWRALRMPFKALLGAFQTGIVESGMRNLPGGDADSAGWRQERASLYPDPTNVSRSAQRFFREWRQFDRPGLSAGEVAARVQRPAAQFRGRYQDARGRAIQLLRSLGIDIPDNMPYAAGGFVGSFARGGEIPGQPGRAVSAVVHAGEWILNKFQQSRLARLLGTNPDSLRSLLGFHGKGGAEGFRGGGQILGREERFLDNIATSQEQKRRLRQIAKGFYELPAFALQDWSELLREVRRAFRAIEQGAKRISNKIKRADARADAVHNLIREGGIFDQMEASRVRFGDVLARRIALLTFKFNRSNRTVTQAGTPLSRAILELDAAQLNIGRTIGQRGSIQRTLNQVTRDLRNLARGTITARESGRARRLSAQQARLREQLDSINDIYTQQLEGIFTAQEAVAQAAIDQINADAERATGRLDIMRRIGTTLGNTSIVDAANVAQRKVIEKQIADLRVRLRVAVRSGNRERIDALTQQIADLSTQVFEMIHQQLRDAVETINRRAQQAMSRFDIINRALDALGVVGLGTAAAGLGISRADIFQGRGRTLARQREELISTRNQAAALGNVGLVEELNDSLLELNTTILENNQAFFNARLEDINSRTGFSTQVNDLNRQILELQGSISGTIDTEGLVTLAEQRAAILETQRDQLQTLMNEAIAEGNQQNINTLTIALLENNVATLQNTQSLKELNGTVRDPQTFSSSAWNLFRQAIFNGNGGLLPQYAMPMITPGQVAAGGSRMPVTTNSINGGVAATQYNDIDVNLTHPVEDVSGLEIGSRVAWALKTANTST